MKAGSTEDRVGNCVDGGAAVLLLFALAVSVAAEAGAPEQIAIITPRGGTIERLDVDAGRLVGESVGELVRRHLYNVTYEDPRFSDPTDYLDITQQFFAVPNNSRVLVLKNRQMSVDLDTSRGVEGMLNQVIAAAAVVHPEAKFRAMKDGTWYHVIPAAGSLLDARISMLERSYTLSGAVKAIGTALKSATGQAVIYGCCLYEEAPGEPLYRLQAHDEPARAILKRLVDQIAAAGRGPATWSILYHRQWDEFTISLLQIPERPVISMPPKRKGG